MDERAQRGITGDHTTDGRPDGFSSITPFLAVPNARDALGFYESVFDAEIGGVTEMPGPDGSSVVVHAEVRCTDGRFQIGEPNPTYHLVAPPGGDDACYSLGIYVTDVDATLDRAVAAGAQVREPATTFVSGDRYASILDPFGVRWSIMTRVEDLSEEESNARVATWAADQHQG